MDRKQTRVGNQKGKADQSTGNQRLPTSGAGNHGESLQFPQERIESVNNTLVKLALVEQLVDPGSSGFCFLAKHRQQVGRHVLVGGKVRMHRTGWRVFDPIDQTFQVFGRTPKTAEGVISRQR